PTALYEPISYILGLGGKRIRPAMVLASYKLYKDQISEEAIELAEVVEMFHNFTLMHDDILDGADLRRGQQTVHKKWDEPTAILSGDLLQILVYQKLSKIGNIAILDLFSSMAVELCEGQMDDMQFETMDNVKNEAYIEMIRQKTAVLLGFSLKAGAMLAGASTNESDDLYDLGIAIGLSFQLMDDYLDSFGEKAKVGKRIGGDILEKKKTYLWNEMWSSLNPTEQQQINEAYKLSEEETIQFVKSKMKETKASNATLELAQYYTNTSLNLLADLEFPNDKSYLEEIVQILSGRES
ncbi:MAG: polyprenyl synthetase family protein, partial [Bacteroidia bacterium]|nr:polyprenyl synthetase family protein [Bacteroidia bacterium]